LAKLFDPRLKKPIPKRCAEQPDEIGTTALTLIGIGRPLLSAIEIREQIQNEIRTGGIANDRCAAG
jgi:hypothetical protein